MRYLLTAVLLFLYSYTIAQVAPSNDDINNALLISNTSAYCSSDAEFNNIDATPSNMATPLNWTTGIGKDVWFKFVATKYDVNISVSGRVNPLITTALDNPIIALYQYSNISTFYSEVPGSSSTRNNVTSFYKGGLNIGEVYYVRVSAQNNAMGTFKLCLDNYFPPVAPGQDCSSASLICSKETFTQLNVSGAGLNNREAYGTCMGTESNSAWYKFTAKEDGTFVFTITPTVSTDDIDWVFYDLGPNGGCNEVIPTNAIRCASGSGVTCFPRYYKTGLSFTETDLNETLGCVANQNGFVKYVDLIKGHNYALLIDNFSSGNNGFTLEFDGTAELEGPKADITYTELNPCTINQSFVFEGIASNYSALEWNFGIGANVTTANTTGPITVKYNSPGEKVVVLRAKSSSSCSDIFAIKRIMVGIKPDKPNISVNTSTFCEDEILRLSTNYIEDATYSWTGPNNYTSNLQNPTIIITGPENTGIYQLTVKINGCESDAGQSTVITTYKKPLALFSVEALNPCTANQSFTINNSSTGYASISWNYDQGINTVLNINSQSQSITYSTSGQKTITLTVENEYGCKSVKTESFYVQIPPETPIITANKTLFCIGDNLELSVNVQEGLTYSWTGPDNFKANSDHVSIPISNLKKAGAYMVTAEINGCVSETATLIIPEIDEIPEASFSLNPDFSAKYSTPLNIQFINQTKNADFYEWDFGDGNTSTLENPSHTYLTAGKFKITLAARSKNGCFNSFTAGDLIVQDNAVGLMPNAFSPNGDGVNDELIINLVNLKTYKITIFNRYGHKVFESSSIFKNWDGKFENKDLPAGVYYYMLNAIQLDQKPMKLSGSVTLIR